MGQRPLGNTDPVRSLLPPIAGPVSDHVLRSLYRPSPRRSVRAMMVSTVDGAATGSDGTSSSINDTVDARAFAATRHHADVVLVGAGTVDAEGYPPLREEDPDGPVLAVVSGAGRLPASAHPRSPGTGSVLLVTCAPEDALREARRVLGEEDLIRCPANADGKVDLVVALDRLRERGLEHVVLEGGPHLLAAALRAGLVDELALTWVPRLVGGDHPRIVAPPAPEVALEPVHLLEQDGTLLGLWGVRR